MMILSLNKPSCALTVGVSLIEIKRISLKDAQRICKVWHYSKTVTAGRTLNYGVWQDSTLVGTVIFGFGPGKTLGQSEGFKPNEICELCRVALSGKQLATSQVLAKCLKVFKKENPKIKAIYSYSDMNQEHYGTIYQATNWIYLGHVKSNPRYINFKGEEKHNRSIKSSKHAKAMGFMKVSQKIKHKYVFPLTKKHKRILSKLHKPYPKKPCEGLTEQLGDQPNE